MASYNIKDASGPSMFCVVVILSVWGCIPDSTDVNYEPSDEYRMKDVERKLEMLENNQNW